MTRIVYVIEKYAARKKIVSLTSNKDRSLDVTGNKYSKIEVSDTNAALEVLYIFIAYPVFWALFEQQVSLQIMFALVTTIFLIPKYIMNPATDYDTDAWFS